MAYFTKYKSRTIKPTPTIPLEYDEQCLLVQYLELKGLLFSASMQETYSMSLGQKFKHRRSGLRKGLPDMFVCLPPEKTKGGVGILLAIEMKRIKNSKTSPEQQEWQDSLNRVLGVEARVCKGFDEAKMFVDSFLK